MKDVVKALEVIVGLPKAYKFIPVLEKLHLKSERIGGTAAKTAVSLEFRIRIFKLYHDKVYLMSKST